MCSLTISCLYLESSFCLGSIRPLYITISGCSADCSTCATSNVVILSGVHIFPSFSPSLPLHLQVECVQLSGVLFVYIGNMIVCIINIHYLGNNETTILLSRFSYFMCLCFVTMHKLSRKKGCAGGAPARW